MRGCRAAQGLAVGPQQQRACMHAACSLGVISMLGCSRSIDMLAIRPAAPARGNEPKHPASRRSNRAPPAEHGASHPCPAAPRSSAGLPHSLPCGCVLPSRSKVKNEIDKLGGQAVRGLIKIAPFGVQALTSACAFSMGLGAAQVRGPADIHHMPTCPLSSPATAAARLPTCPACQTQQYPQPQRQ